MKTNKKIGKSNFFQNLSRAIIFPLIFVGFLVFINGIFLVFNSFVFQDVLNFFLNTLFIFISFFFLYFYTKEKKELSFIFFIIVFLFFFLFQNIFIKNDLFLLNENKEYIIKSFYGISYFSFTFFSLFLLAFLNGFIFNKYFIEKKKEFYFYYFLFNLFFIFLYILLFPIFYYLIFNSLLLTIRLPYGFDAFFYGFLNRLFVIFGTQIITNALFNYSSLGGQIISVTDGEVVSQGEIGIWFFCYTNSITMDQVREYSNTGALLLDEVNGETYYFTYGINPGQYEQGLLDVTIFILPAISIAYFKNTKNKKFLWFALFVIFTGISEPIEFLFIEFLPIYLFYCFFVGLNFMILDLLNTSVIISMGTILDLLFFGIFPQVINNFYTNFQFIIYIGLIDFVIFFSLFNFLLKNKKLKTKKQFL
ncbi:MAG: hypothetical protein HPAVJP_5360 [Candidatus Hepatoplasma vulgare]|nr:MAG: hypothetical protein HPAVJP_5360 [Candidatus Hepatoplasma sp.]